jgi:hypothetical protein
MKPDDILFFRMKSPTTFYFSERRKLFFGHASNGHFILRAEEAVQFLFFNDFVITGLKVTICTASRLFSFLASGGL